MESPKRRALKSRDYRRHRMMRLLNRRKATALEAMSEIAERELMRRLRITPLKKFEDGKDAEYERIDDSTPGMTGMMKAALATAAHFGNPTARRMTNYDTRSYVWPDEYEEDGIFMEPRKGNVYVASYDNLVTPRIQDAGRGLVFVNDVWSPENEQRSYSQSLKFNNEEDARYFGEHYKEIAPMMHLYTGGGTAVSQNPYYVNIKNYPVVNAEDEGLSEYFMNHKDVAGMAIGAGANGIDGPRRIVMNPYSDVLKTDLQKEGLIRIEAVRHAMEEYNYKPSFKLSKHQKNLQKTVFKNMPYGSNDEAFKRSIISRILVGDTGDLQPTSEQEAEAARFIFNNDSNTTKKPKKFSGGKGLFDSLDEYAEEYEPYAAGLAIGSDAVALGTAATGVGAPIGAAIATAGNIPNLAIDAYQAARNWYKYGVGENDNLMTPIISTGEAVLDAAGVNSALKGISYLKDRAIVNEAARIFERELASRQGRRILLRKRGMSDEEITGYLAQKAANAALNSKELAQTKKKETSKQNRRSAVAKPAVRATSNIVTNFVAPQYFDAQNNYKPVWQRN